MTRMLLSLGLSALVMGGTTVGCATGGDGIASAGTRAATGREARLADRALVRRDVVSAIGYAEAAVAAAPARADYRLLLGRSYLQAGRFRSARDALADALHLAPQDGRAALNLALAQIATGDWQAARGTLDAHATRIAAPDRGLAIALAGDPARAVALLTAAAREPGATAKVRQNLGLALALSGQWGMARAVAAADLSPADVDGRMQDWARFAQPARASDQVAALLGVAAQPDGGQPVALALVAPVPAAVPAPVPAAAPAPTTAAAAIPQTPLPAAGIVFAAPRAVVQPLPTPLLPPAARPMRIAAAPVRAAAGEWFVQLGAFADARGAQAAWQRLARGDAAVGGHQPHGTVVRTRAGTLHRLSVGGFDRAGADALCRRHRAGGGACFVRRGAGDRLAQWLRTPGMQLARR